MTSIFRTTAPDTPAPTPDASLRIQTSIEGLARARIWGVTRVAGNLIWYGDFYAITVQSGGSSGGKGGLFGAPASTSSSFNYFASVELAIGERVAAIGPVMWASKARTTISDVAGGGGGPPPPPSGLTVSNTNFGVFLGDQAQLPWSYLTSNHPDQAFAYRLTAYLAGNINLGSGAELPNWTFEVTGVIANSVPGQPDADAMLMTADFLTNADSGVAGWLAEYNGDWTDAQNYLLASNLLVSYALTAPTRASAFLQEFLTSLNVMPVWSESVLKIVPRGDMAVAGNGHVYNPPDAPIYDHDDTDFLPNQASFGGTNADPVSGQQTPSRKQDNVVKVEFLDRSSDYNQASLSAPDDGAILLFGERCSDGVKQWHWFQNGAAAQMAAQLGLGRKQISNKYAYTLRPRYILLDPGDIVTITDEKLGLFRQWVRIIDIAENQDRSLNFLVEEYLQGTASAPEYGRQVAKGSKPNYSADPGGVNPPFIFEPTDQLAGGLEVWAAVSGVNTTLYGGCDAYISYDGETYSRVPGGRQFGSARMGYLTAPLAAVPANPTGQTIDAAHTLSVDLTESAGALASGTQADALNLNTACWVNGEIVSYQTATLTGPNKYDLTYLVRGAYGTENIIANHAAGEPFARIDNGIMRVPFDQTRIGATIYLKFLPFNIWGVTVQSLADVPAYTYKITGVALASPLPPVTQVRTVFKDGFAEIWWQEIDDFRSGIRYVVRKGDSFEGGQELGTQAHPPLVAFGAGTYWIMPTCQPVAGLIVYGEDPVSITIQGNMLTTNIVQTVDFKAIGWPGAMFNVGREGVDPDSVLRLAGAGDILSDPSVLTNPDILNSGGIALSGTYIANTVEAVLNVGYVADCSVNITWSTAGIPVGSDVLTDPDILNNPDILSTGSSAFVEVWVEIRTGTNATNDMFAPSDMFAEGDFFDSSIEWGPWQRYVPGVYRAQYIEYQVKFSTLQPNIIAYLQSLIVQVSIPARIDHYVGNTVPVGGLTIIFEPDDATAAKPFNGGPLVAGTFNHPLPTLSMDWAGHAGVVYVIDALSLSQVTFHMEDGTGLHVQVTGVDIVVEGY
jgi:hypothetical protein